MGVERFEDADVLEPLIDESLKIEFVRLSVYSNEEYVILLTVVRLFHVYVELLVQLQEDYETDSS